MSGLRILIAGGGIAGPVLAFWLARAGAKVTIVERAAELRAAGQSIDIRGAGLTVVRRMGLEDSIREVTTHEAGIAFVDRAGIRKAEFGMSASGDGQGFSSEFEIVRGDLVQILYDSTKDNVEYLFDNGIKSLDDDGEKVKVTFAKRDLQRDFDIVIAADGLGSSTRKLAFDQDKSEIIKSLGQYCALFTIPRSEKDSKWSQWYNAPGGRNIFLRPNTEKRDDTILASLAIMNTSERIRNHSKLSVEEQKKLMHDLFDDAGWEAERVLAGMDKADDFYMQHVAQVKMDRWTNGRVALVGDAAYCPSPISGMGTSVAIVGAYVLAGEIAKHSKDHQAAFAGYESILRPYVTKAQSLPPGAPAIANPQTQFGINVFNAVLGFVSWTKLDKLFGAMGFGSPPAEAIDLPDYEL